MDNKKVNQSILQVLKVFEHTITRYHSYDDSLHFMMLVDKLQFAFDMCRSYILHELIKTPSKKDKNGEPLSDKKYLKKMTEYETTKSELIFVFDKFKKELNDLEAYIKKPYSELNTKLDAVLMGPDYEKGRELMEEAKQEWAILSTDDDVKTI